ncbi:MAG: 16S rRNA (cytosine(1402)-N(4))-methyltransferase RsmH [Nitrospirota bacterium]|nr:MAG: 16S rRNA (cytosine(1402)-N(4))-methyltransferase RsmH [Nitrospirota bacterium]
MNDVHVPVLAEEICHWLSPKSGGIYVDCTLGVGGTSLKILESSGNNAYIIGLDRDPEALAIAEKNLEPYGSHVKIFNGNYSHIVKFVHQAGFEKVDGVVFDLGVSSLQLDKPARGFSFSSDGPLDMRMNQAQGPTAADLVKVLPEKELADLIFSCGEERFSRRIARAIVQARKTYALDTTQALVAVIKGAVPHAYRKGRIHCATRTFQALRIRVNQELDLLQPSLQDAVSLLKEGGRLCVVAFHSLEDRVVKHTFRAMAGGENPLITLLTKKPIVADTQEIQQNPRARSAKLRIAQRLPEGVHP